MKKLSQGRRLNHANGRRGRPRTNATPIMVRVSPDLLGKLDKWRKSKLKDKGRPAAIRLILEGRLRRL